MLKIINFLIINLSRNQHENMDLHKKIVARVILISLSLNIASALASDNTYATTQISSSECYDNYGMPRVSVFRWSIILRFDNFHTNISCVFLFLGCTFFASVAV